ncbi:hypothetical protein D6D13_07777 [Aureobasidium pullulans]|uniref:Uncharacterized protein n=1 Tax=Aureobasidium pullulans TaxID=5580 RepID=A0A4S9CC66_AURPU|nr:hypothetical protein D6D13_07777 [Aureobasidium pullulans]
MSTTTIITPPEPRTLFPPLLACLPTAFMSPRPPPALLPLLSPILRQRVNLLAGNTSSGQGGWLNLLSWSTSRSSKLGGKIENLQLEAHPVSGELELEDIDKVGYRRVDEETLQCCLQVEEFGLLPVYVWCENDAEGGQTGGTTGWRLAELRALEDLSDDIAQWTDSIADANDFFESQSHPNAPATTSYPQHASAADEDDDDDYWASYDRTPNNRTPARTPAKRASPAPQASAAATSSNLGPTKEELEYFARYAEEVQPALDDHDPDEETPETANSTLRGGELSEQRSVPTQPAGEPNINPAPPMYASSNNEFNNVLQKEQAELEAPRPTSPASSVDKLERGAEDMTRAEVGVKQFISTEMKSMYRLARSVGMGREEFERIIKTEIDVLGMLEADD